MLFFESVPIGARLNGSAQLVGLCLVNVIGVMECKVFMLTGNG